MRTNILLAIDVPTAAPQHIDHAAAVIGELVRDGADHVVVLHVQEFSIPKLAANMLDHGGASGRRAVDEVVAGLRAEGIQASGLVREADFGHVARTILGAADEFDARVIVLGSRTRAEFPRVPAGSVAAHVMRHAMRAVLIDPRISDNRSPASDRTAARV
jgi:nucleotide-binding universal stress UspA family protein